MVLITKMNSSSEDDLSSCASTTISEIDKSSVTGSEVMRKLIIYDVPDDMSYKDLLNVFQIYGPVQRVQLNYRPEGKPLHF